MIDRSQKLQELIDDNPGIQFREIMRSSGLKNGVLSHYLKKLEDGGLVKVMRGPRQVRFYSPNITEAESIVIKATPRIGSPESESRESARATYLGAGGAESGRLDSGCLESASLIALKPRGCDLRSRLWEPII